MLETCPNCGAEVPTGAKACPECGSCEKTGWSDEAAHGGLDLPDAEFNYDDFVQREFGGRARPKTRRQWLWWVVGLLALAAFLAWLWRH